MIANVITEEHSGLLPLLRKNRGTDFFILYGTTSYTRYDRGRLWYWEEHGSIFLHGKFH